MDLDARMKLYEQLHNHTVCPRLPLIARIDGRAWHTWTKKCQRPFDAALHKLMQQTLIGLVKEFCPVIGYTQSDELSLIFWQKEHESQHPFGGRINKLNSVLASYATKVFSETLIKTPHPMLTSLPNFDTRCFVVPSQDEACNYLLWRWRDCAKNSIAMAAQAKFSHKGLHGKDQNQMQEMLFQVHGINWNNYPAEQKGGSWVRRENYKGPNNSTRSRVAVIQNMPRFDTLNSKVNFVFNGASHLDA